MNLAKGKRPFCGLCFGRGYRKVGVEYVNCTCGRLPNSTGAYKMAQQDELKKRLARIKVQGW